MSLKENGVGFQRLVAAMVKAEAEPTSSVMTNRPHFSVPNGAETPQCVQSVLIRDTSPIE